MKGGIKGIEDKKKKAKMLSGILVLVMGCDKLLREESMISYDET